MGKLKKHEKSVDSIFTDVDSDNSADLSALREAIDTKEPVRVIELLRALFPAFSSQKLLNCVHRGSCFVDGKREFRESRAFASQEVVSVFLGPVVFPMPLNSQNLIRETKDYVVVNKPPLLASVPSQAYAFPNIESELKGLLLGADMSMEARKWGFEAFKEELYACHRLDFATSGAILVARNKPAHHRFQTLFANRKIEKYYLCVVEGIASFTEDSCDYALTSQGGFTFSENQLNPLDNTLHMNVRDRQHLKKLQAGLKPARTVFKSLATNSKSNSSLLLAIPETGRTHQIRVHAAQLGLPLLGDRKYNVHSILSRHSVPYFLLHAVFLKWKMGRRVMEITADLSSNEVFAAYITKNYPGFNLESALRLV